MRTFLRILFATVIIGLLAVVNSLFIINIWIISFDDLLGYKDTVYPYGIILGASVSPDGDLSQALQDRVDAAIAAYNDGVIQKIFVSGDDQEYYKEVTTIATYLQEHAIDSKDVVLDPYGVDTYDSMRRASHLYGVAKALIFTQQYHLSRSVYLARKLGIHADGFPVDSGSDWGTDPDHVREFFARIKAFLEVELLHPRPEHVELDS